MLTADVMGNAALLLGYYNCRPTIYTCHCTLHKSPMEAGELHKPETEVEKEDPTSTPRGRQVEGAPTSGIATDEGMHEHRHVECTVIHLATTSAESERRVSPSTWRSTHQAKSSCSQRRSRSRSQGRRRDKRQARRVTPPATPAEEPVTRAQVDQLTRMIQALARRLDKKDKQGKQSKNR